MIQLRKKRRVISLRRNIVLTGILKDKDLFLAVKRSDNDNFFPGAWEFPGGHLEDGETLEQGLARELKEEIGYEEAITPVITHYTDEIKEEAEELIHNIELDFIINVNKEKMIIKLSEEHTEYKWLPKDSELLDEYIKEKLQNIKE